MSTFQQSLKSFRRSWRLGQLAYWLLTISITSALIGISYGFADFLWALSSPQRNVIKIVLLIALIGICLFALVRTFFRPQKTIAQLADKLGNIRGAQVSAACDLQQQPVQNELHQYLTEQALQQAGEKLTLIPLRNKVPLKSLAICAMVMLGLAAITLIIRQSNPDAFQTVSQRLMAPDKDIPPYTKLRFHLSAEHPQTYYGGENLVTATITGEELTEPVLCMLRDRDTGQVEATNTFQIDDTSFSRKFNRVVKNFDVAFSCGKARSHWFPVDVLLQPKFSTSKITITPPAYTEGKVTQLALDGNDVKVLAGSTLEFEITSNRPLAKGTLEVTPLSDSDEFPIRSVESSEATGNTIRFRWTANYPARLAFTIRDIRNSPSATPMQVTIATQIDQTPFAEILSPARVVLATPRSTIPLRGNVEDDHAVEQVSLVRTLVGFRDRPSPLTESWDRNQFGFKQALDLKALGVEPGQILEFYLEASDNNPSLLGISTSDLVRVHIISEEEYAKRIRSNSPIEGFTTRFRELKKAIETARLSLLEIDKANRNGDQDTFEQSTETAMGSHKQAEQLARKLASDFHAYDMEEQLGKIAQQTVDRIRENYVELHELNFHDGKGDNEERILRMIDRLGGLHEQAKKLELDAERVKAIGRVMRLAASFRTIYNQQRTLTARTNRIAMELNRGNKRNAALLPHMATGIERNRDALIKLIQLIRSTPDSLPDDLVELKDDMIAFADHADELKITAPLTASADAAKKGRSVEAGHQAQLALQLLQQLINLPENAFAEMIRGKLPKNKLNAPPNMEKTLEQMLQAMMNKVPKPRDGNGQPQQGEMPGGAQGGDGMGNGGNSGIAMGNLPLYGPERLNFDSPQSGSAGNDNSSKGLGRNAKVLPEHNRHQPSNSRDSHSSKLPRGKVPESYRSAVRKFYSQPKP